MKSKSHPHQKVLNSLEIDKNAQSLKRISVFNRENLIKVKNFIHSFRNRFYHNQSRKLFIMSLMSAFIFDWFLVKFVNIWNTIAKSIHCPSNPFHFFKIPSPSEILLSNKSRSSISIFFPMLPLSWLDSQVINHVFEAFIAFACILTITQ